ncbi:MAG: S-methyl-5-thioribose-1-phosphate isomerase [bacterium]
MRNQGGSALPSFVFRAIRYRQGRLEIIDQRVLPGRVRWIELTSARTAAAAIRTLAVRGAPAIGVAAAYALAVEARRLRDRQLRSSLRRAGRLLVQTRPTAVNLPQAVDRVLGVLGDSSLHGDRLRDAVERRARELELAEVERSLRIADAGAGLVPEAGEILTICNTGALAAPGIGTALGIIIEAHRRGRHPRVLACETRPLLQGARLTMLELKRAGIPATLIVDSAAASVIGGCALVVVGADRIARNGDTANKVGTRMLAVLAADAGVPFYVAAPSSTFDPDCARGVDISVEERPADEITSCANRRIAPQGTRAFNPAFDITPARFIAAFVTDRGIIRRPFGHGIARLLRGD